MIFARAAVQGFLVFALAGCAGFELADPTRPPPGSARLQQGYVMGCIAGFYDGGRIGYHDLYVVEPDDPVHFPRDLDYRMGWLRGHAACLDEQRRAPQVTGVPG